MLHSATWLLTIGAWVRTRKQIRFRDGWHCCSLVRCSLENACAYGQAHVEIGWEKQRDDMLATEVAKVSLFRFAQMSCG